MHFPEEYSCTFDPQTKMFNFVLDISLKYSIVKTVIAWNTQPFFKTIIYDAKFVALLLNFVIGKDNLKRNNLPKECLRFIRGILALFLYRFASCVYHKSHCLHHFSNILTPNWRRSASCNTIRRVYSFQSFTTDGKNWINKLNQMEILNTDPKKSPWHINEFVFFLKCFFSSYFFFFLSNLLN